MSQFQSLLCLSRQTKTCQRPLNFLVQQTGVGSNALASVHVCHFTSDTLNSLPHFLHYSTLHSLFKHTHTHIRCHRWDPHRLPVRTICRPGIGVSLGGLGWVLKVGSEPPCGSSFSEENSRCSKRRREC